MDMSELEFEIHRAEGRLAYAQSRAKELKQKLEEAKQRLAEERQKLVSAKPWIFFQDDYVYVIGQDNAIWRAHRGYMSDESEWQLVHRVGY